MKPKIFSYCLCTLCLCSLLQWLTACGGGDSEAVPRRYAYPRVAVYDSVYTAVDSFPLHLEVNSQAGRRLPKAGWLDVAYPAYGAVMHVSVRRLSADSLQQEIESRRERMALNLYGLTAETIHTASADSSFESVVLCSSDPVNTPLQFLATDGRGMLVSGSVYLPQVTADTPADSLAPIVAALRRDVLHSMKNLGYATH